jgi:hypothetical protein
MNKEVLLLFSNLKLEKTNEIRDANHGINC